MSKQYNPRDQTRNKLANLNKRVSNKKSRYRTQKGIELNPHIQTKQADDFTSRKELEKYVRQMERFLDRRTQFVQNSNNVIFNKKSVEKYQKEVERINRLKEKERKRIEELETQVKGKKLGMKLGKRLEMAAPNIFPTLTKLSGSIDRFSSENEMKKVVKERFQEGFFRGNFINRVDRQYKENFIKALESEFQGQSKRLRKHIERLNIQDFMDVYYQTLGTIDIDYVYEESENNKSRLQVLERTFGI